MTEPKKPLSKQARARKIKQIYRDMEAQKRALGLRAPAIKRGPVFYFVVLMVLLMVGGALIQAAGKGGGKKMRDGRLVQAEQSVAALAEALGRYKFHCGVYPTAEEGLEALVLKHSRHAGWVGPYISSPNYIPTLLPDPWSGPTCTSPRTIRRRCSRSVRTACAARRTTSRPIRRSSRSRSRTPPGRTTGWRSIGADTTLSRARPRRRKRNEP